MEKKGSKIQVLEAKLKRYQAKLHHLLTEEPKWPDARYGNEFLQNQIKVYQAMIRATKEEIERLRRS